MHLAQLFITLCTLPMSLFCLRLVIVTYANMFVEFQSNLSVIRTYVRNPDPFFNKLCQTSNSCRFLLYHFHSHFSDNFSLFLHTTCIIDVAAATVYSQGALTQIAYYNFVFLFHCQLCRHTVATLVAFRAWGCTRLFGLRDQGTYVHAEVASTLFCPRAPHKLLPLHSLISTYFCCNFQTRET